MIFSPVPVGDSFGPSLAQRACAGQRECEVLHGWMPCLLQPFALDADSCPAMASSSSGGRRPNVPTSQSVNTGLLFPT